MLRGEGVQVFECLLRPGNPPRHGWAFLAPRVTLYDGAAAVGRHLAGPTWESLTDRSSVSAAIIGRQHAGSGNLPWLLLRSVPVGESGLFAGVTSIQRVNTAGGVPAPSECNPSSVGRVVEVPFTADYYFYRRLG